MIKQKTFSDGIVLACVAARRYRYMLASVPLGGIIQRPKQKNDFI